MTSTARTISIGPSYRESAFNAAMWRNFFDEKLLYNFYLAFYKSKLPDQLAQSDLLYNLLYKVGFDIH